MIISILVCLILFINGFLVGWLFEDFKKNDYLVEGTLTIGLVGFLIYLIYGITALIKILWEWIKSL